MGRTGPTEVDFSVLHALEPRGNEFSVSSMWRKYLWRKHPTLWWGVALEFGEGEGKWTAGKLVISK